jgi:hypothetical protein
MRESEAAHRNPQSRTSQAGNAAPTAQAVLTPGHSRDHCDGYAQIGGEGTVEGDADASCHLRPEARVADVPRT